VFRELGDSWGRALALKNLGDVAREQGDVETAHTHYAESLGLCHEAANRPGAIEALEGLARLAAVQGQLRQAARLWGAAAGLRERSGTSPPPVERAAYDRNVAELRGQLGEREFAARWAEWQALPLGLAVSYALAGPADDGSMRSAAPGGTVDVACAYPASLTRREVEVLRLLGGGQSNRAIADELVVSIHTVARHVTNIYTKIGARGRSGATAYALRHGLV
jgi:DNA-binding CsgD family transcriptional regulator